MMAMRLILAVSWTFWFCVLALSLETSNQRLVVVLLDGMRWDYVRRDKKLRGLPRIAKEGVTVPYVCPVYPSISYPNWYTIVTGLYTESHGMIGNNMYDPVRKDSFSMAPHPNATHLHWWNQTEPLWVNAEKNGIRTAMHWWDGCQIPIRGVKTTVCDEYRPFFAWKTFKDETRNKLSGILDWFSESKNNKLVLLYYEDVDATGHHFGPDAPETFQAVRDIDGILGSFQEHLDDSEFKNEVNLVIVSDHGMADIEKFELIRLDDFNVVDNIEMILDGGAFATILPKPGKELEVYSTLKQRNVEGLHVYRRDEIPEKYHFKKGRVTMPILLVADLGYYITKPGSSMKKHPGIGGNHGFDPYFENSPMRTLMLAKGPAFKSGVVGGPLDQTDHYNVFCHILGIEPHPNNGSWDRVQGLLAVNSGNSGTLSLFVIFQAFVFHKIYS